MHLAVAVGGLLVLMMDDGDGDGNSPVSVC